MHKMLLSALLYLAALACQGAAPETIALVGGHIIDGTGAPASRDAQTILIRGERIVAIGARVKVPKGATVIDVAGRTVLPGLIDMHGHLYARVGGNIKNVFDAYPSLYLAGGVTTVRSPGDFDPESTYELKQSIAQGKTVGSRIFMGGYYIDHNPSKIRWMKPVNTPQEATQRIVEWRSRIDVVKFYTSVTDEELQAGLAEAKRLGLPTAGHLGSISASRAIDLGIEGLEHGIYAMSDLGAPNPEPQPGCPLGDLDVGSAQVDALIGKIVQRHVAIDPTFVIMTLTLPDVAPFTPDWRDYFANPELVASAEQMLFRMREKIADPQQLACAQRTREKAMQFVKKVHERGGVILAGTDPVAPYVLPGWGLHRELKYLTQAGLTPLAAIRAATYDAAVVLRKEKELGSITVGKLADLVVVSGNPARQIEDIGNTEIVFQAGKRYDPKALRAAAKGRIQ